MISPYFCRRPTSPGRLPAYAITLALCLPRGAKVATTAPVTGQGIRHVASAADSSPACLRYQAAKAELAGIESQMLALVQAQDSDTISMSGVSRPCH